MTWFYVRLNGAGTLKKCAKLDEVPVPITDRHFDAPNHTDAVTAAKQLHREKYNVVAAARRARFREGGLCRCGRTIEEGSEFITCGPCRQRRLETAQRRRARDKVNAPPPPLKPARVNNRFDAGEKRKLEKQFEYRLMAAHHDARHAVLQEVRKQWEDSRTLGGFTNWLATEITGAGGRV